MKKSLPQDRKTIDERKRNIPMMTYRHLISRRYAEAVIAITYKCNADMEKRIIFDNMDLFQIVQDFKEYNEIKFMKRQVLVKMVPEIN